jgi:hypothetical protein
MMLASPQAGATIPLWNPYIAGLRSVSFSYVDPAILAVRPSSRPRQFKRNAMSISTATLDLKQLDHRLDSAPVLSMSLMTDVVVNACSRLALLRHSDRAATVERLIASGAWTDAALALIALELPQWQLRRLVYDDGEWHCSLSRQREMPDWLDQPVEAHHADMATAILRAFVGARQIATPVSKSSVPATPRSIDKLDETLCCDNFA